jgi:hypothetical protein
LNGEDLPNPSRTHAKNFRGSTRAQAS